MNAGWTSRRAGALAFCLVGAFPQSASAQANVPESQPGRWHLGLRTGFGIPLGTYADVRTQATLRDENVNALSDDTHGVIPLWFDVGYRFARHFMIGGYFMFGIVLPKAARANDPLGGGCPEGFDCAASGMRFGLQGQYAFAPGAVIDPWLGLAIGYERIQTELQGQLFGIDLDASSTYSGPDLLQLQVGVDFHSGERLALGPFVAASAMQYTSCSLTLAGEESSCELNDGGWHGWLALGARGALEL
jgi:hypothetical protein